MRLKQAFEVELEDGRVLEAHVDNRDMIRWDEARLGKAEDFPFVFNNYLAWSALAREDLIDGMPFAAFKQVAVSVMPGEAEDADPTQPVPSSG